MTSEKRAIVGKLPLLMLCVVFHGCGSPESPDSLAAQFDKMANAQALPGRESTSTVEVDRTQAQSVFANATEVIPADREVVLDFGLRPLPGNGGPTEPTTSVRLYLNYYTAKRLNAALLLTVERHVNVFGPVGEDDPAQMKTPPQVALRPNYVNFVRLTGTPEELLMEAGLNLTPVGVPSEPIPIQFTVIMDFQTGNSFLTQLSSVLEQYEKEHGAIETDVQKRVVGGAAR